MIHKFKYKIPRFFYEDNSGKYEVQFVIEESPKRTFAGIKSPFGYSSVNIRNGKLTFNEEMHHLPSATHNLFSQGFIEHSQNLLNRVIKLMVFS